MGRWRVLEKALGLGFLFCQVDIMTIMTVALFGLFEDYMS